MSSVVSEIPFHCIGLFLKTAVRWDRSGRTRRGSNFGGSRAGMGAFGGQVARLPEAILTCGGCELPSGAAWKSAKRTGVTPFAPCKLQPEDKL